MGVLPGVALAAILATCGWLAARLIAEGTNGGSATPISPVLLAVLFGILWRNTRGVSLSQERGLAWVMNSAMKTGIALVGLRLSLHEASAVAVTAAPVVLGCLTIALASGVAIARVSRIPLRLAGLLTAGTAICGCTAVVALGAAIRARPAEIAFALTCIVVLGCGGMLAYPWVAGWLFEDSPVYAGIFLGTAIHDTSQVIGAGLIYSDQHAQPQALAAAGITKFLRNLFIAVLVPAGAWVARRSADAVSGTGEFVSVPARQRVIPTFVICFVLFVVIRSIGDSFFRGTSGAHAWAALVATGKMVSEGLLLCGMAAVGLSMSVSQVRRIGMRPLFTAVALACTAAAGSALLTVAAQAIPR